MAGLRSADPETCAALRELISGTDLPVVETFQAAGAVGRELEDHYIGRVGLFRNQPGDLLISHADVLVTIGYDPVEYDPGLEYRPRPDLVHIDTLPANIDNDNQPTAGALRPSPSPVTAGSCSAPRNWRRPPAWA